MYDEHVVTEPVMTVLIDAASNSDIAHYLNNDDFLDILHGVHILPVAQHSLKVLARQLEARIRTWDIFEDALSNTEGDFNAAGNMLAEIGSNEVSFGIWLETMTIHEHLRDKIASHPTPSTQIPPPCLFQATASSTSHAEFIVFVRAYIGVAYVLVVLAWADSLGHDYCRERALAVLHLWQSVEGYSEVSESFFSHALWLILVSLDRQSPVGTATILQKAGVDHQRGPPTKTVPSSG